ncbi:Uncharacterized protein TCM_029969 [Theobroma cacao]|uniref:DUF295 domain-containing protein n=1 Tax=Theobroma cacao TaxID=3641 RepID=A0A061GG39_THECC|nr:Uncharacterized protein TCM_029969 [Theobroma cacao]
MSLCFCLNFANPLRRRLREFYHPLPRNKFLTRDTAGSKLSDVTNQLSRAREATFPCLFLSHQLSAGYFLFFPHNSTAVSVGSGGAVDFRNVDVLSSCPTSGWLLLMHGYQVFYFNVRTQDRFDLPDLPASLEGTRKGCFSRCPTDESNVTMIIDHQSISFLVYRYKSDIGYWVQDEGLVVPDTHLDASTHTKVDDEFYWVCKSDNQLFILKKWSSKIITDEELAETRKKREALDIQLLSFDIDVREADAVSSVVDPSGCFLVLEKNELFELYKLVIGDDDVAHTVRIVDLNQKNFFTVSDSCGFWLSSVVDTNTLYLASYLEHDCVKCYLIMVSTKRKNLKGNEKKNGQLRLFFMHCNSRVSLNH